MEPTQGWFAPAAALRPWVEGYWAIEGAAGGPSECVLPDGCCEIVFDLGDPFRRVRADGSTETQPRALVAGQIDGALELVATGRIELFGIRFAPHGAYPFLRLPIDSLLNSTPALGDAAPRLERALLAALESAPDDVGARVRALDAALLRALDGRAGVGDARVAEGVRRIARSRGTLKIDALARHVGLGARQLERLFLREVGLGPKRLARIQRFQALVKAAATEEVASWAALAAELGFSDQAHLVREFRAFAGVSPGHWSEGLHTLARFFSRPFELDSLVLARANGRGGHDAATRSQSEP